VFLKNIPGVERYREASDVYTDLSLVFWNALFYNEPDSEIGSLKNLLVTEWTKRSVLPRLRTSSPPSSTQKVHSAAAESNNTALPPPPATPADPDIDITTHDSNGPEEDERFSDGPRFPE